MKIKRIIKSPLLFLYKFGLQKFGGRGLQKIWPLGAIRDWLSGALRTYGRPNSVIFRGETIFLDPNDNLELSVWGERHGASREIGLLESFLKEGDTAVDVGANIGLMTIFMARAVGKGGRVFAFEPAPDNIALLRKNLEANHHENVAITSVAVSDKPGTLKLFLSDFNPGDHRIYDPEEKTRDWEKNDAVYDKLVGEKRIAIDVPVVSLDDFFKDYKKPIAFIKMDVQGAEGGVLKGMTGILKKNPSVKLMTEFWPAGLKMFGMGAEEVLAALESLGFFFYETSAPEKKINKDELLRKYTVENNKTTDLLIKRQI